MADSSSDSCLMESLSSESSSSPAVSWTHVSCTSASDLCTVFNHTCTKYSCIQFFEEIGKIKCIFKILHKDVCSSNASEDNVETLSGQLELSDFVITPGTGGDLCTIETLSLSFSLSGTTLQLQSHVHWLLELAIKLVANLSSGNTTSVRIHCYTTH